MRRIREERTKEGGNKRRERDRDGENQIQGDPRESRDSVRDKLYLRVKLSERVIK